MNISISKSGKKEDVIKELREDQSDQRKVAGVLATYIDTHAVPECQVTVSVSGSVSFTAHPEP
jgi:hypothetical protein